MTDQTKDNDGVPSSNRERAKNVLNQLKDIDYDVGYLHYCAAVKNARDIIKQALCDAEKRGQASADKSAFKKGMLAAADIANDFVDNNSEHLSLIRSIRRKIRKEAEGLAKPVVDQNLVDIDHNVETE